MGTIVITENISLDGVIQDPTGEDGTSFGGWFLQIGDADRAAWAELLVEEARNARALLLGRRSDEYFAARWTSRTGEWAERLNSLPKYVVSATLDKARWNNGTVLSGDVVKEVTALKESVDGPIVVNASGRLARTLIEHDLVDKLRLIVFPYVLGGGERLFGDLSAMRTLRRHDVRALGSGLVLLTYHRA
jgi:dihydrofolate reductase